MFSKALVGSILVASLALQAYAHAGFSPALGVNGDLQRSDVKRPNKDCGGGDVTKIDATTSPATIGTNSQVQVTVENFNGGGDGSRAVQTALINTDGGGKNFSPATVVVNGNSNPNNNGKETLTIQLPANTQCTGGSKKNRCLLSLTTTAGFGNCVVLQSSNNANNANNANTASAATSTATGTATTNPALFGCGPAATPLTSKNGTAPAALIAINKSNSSVPVPASTPAAKTKRSRFRRGLFGGRN